MKGDDLMNFLFKIWIINIDFSTIISFLIGVIFGATLICLIYALLVVASLRNKKFIIKTDADTLTTKEVKEMILESQKNFKDKDLMGSNSKISHCKDICTGLVYGIATRFYPNSKYPLLELSVDEALILSSYIRKRIEEILDRKVLRLLKKMKISTIFDLTQKTNKVTSSKAFKLSKEANTTINGIMKVVNVVNPVWWFRKIVISKTTDIITGKLCMVIIAVVGEETYKIYSKTVFKENVEIETNVDALLSSIDKDLQDASDEIKTEKEKKKDDIVIPTNEFKYRFKSYSYTPSTSCNYKSLFDEKYPLMKKNYNQEGQLNEEE